MNDKKGANDVMERLNIQEKALSNLADSLKKHEVETVEEIKDLQAELKSSCSSREISPSSKSSFPRSRER